jgi:NADPH:quinone reductase-like Zn-dependent oxidoreductase
MALTDKLVYCDIDKPVPTDNEVLVKVIAVSLNAADYRSIKMGLIPKRKILGSDVAGVVDSTGSNIKQYRPGDDVIGELAGYGFGGLAEYAVAPERVLVPKPAGMSFRDAAALPMAGLTALKALNKGKIREGHKVLIIGSSGGVGTFALQLAKYFGAMITAVCNTNHVEQANALGADHVIDYTKEDFTKSNNLYDLIVAVNGSYSLTASKRILNPDGVYVMVGGALSQIIKSILFGWMLSFGSRKMRFLPVKSSQKDLEFIVKLASEGKIRPVIDSCFPLDKTADAMRYLSKGHAGGKVVINIH